MKRPKNITQKTSMAALPLHKCLAKTYTTPQGTLKPGRTIFEHACITGKVAQLLIALYPQFLRDIFFPPGSVYLTSSHDVGKASPTFQNKLYHELYKKSNIQPPLGLEKIDPDIEKNWGGHAGTGWATLDDIGVGKDIAGIIGKHHGRLTKHTKLSTGESLGGEAWHERRIELLNELKIHFNEGWPQVNSPSQADVLAGLTTVADWIASGHFFDNPEFTWQNLVEPAVHEAGFVETKIKPCLSFKAIFGKDPYPIQEQFYNACTKPGIYILEAPMGLGKTEAALYAAYKLLSEKAATGLYFAMPTRLTSDKIYQRVQPFLKEILATDSSQQHAFLLHGGDRWLQDTELGEEGSPGGEWFNYSLKRAILAPFGVGTIDQALLAALPDVRHSFLRSFGLLGKIVILDEVHSYDGYTSILLDSLIARLRKLHCTVIILSATLTRDRRATMLATKVESNDYPLVSAIELDDPNLREIILPPDRKVPDHDVILHTCDADQNALNEALERSSNGQQVLWIENTVTEAQAIFKKLKSQNDGKIEVGLLHSRFIANDRKVLEDQWIGYYGKDGHERGKCGRILVGTQVLEQSLDIDADFLVTRLCPMDMFLQRTGRLWRHNERDNRASAARREAWLLVPALTEAIEVTQLGKSAKIYEPYILFRTMEVLRPETMLSLPCQIRQLIEDTYKERNENCFLDKLKTEMKKNAEKLNREALLAQSELNQDRDESIATRYSTWDTTPVMLLSKKPEVNNDGFHLHFMGGEKLFFPKNIKAYNMPEWRKLALSINSNMLSVAKHLAPECAFPKQTRDLLQKFVYMGEREDSALRIAIVTESAEIKTIDGGSASGKYRLEYAKHLGYVADKK
jgi:CRISPR-associated endonuclease/helicase Cas3